MKTKHVTKSHEAQDLQRLELSPAASTELGGALVPSHLRGLGSLTDRESTSSPPAPRVNVALTGHLPGALSGGDLK